MGGMADEAVHLTPAETNWLNQHPVIRIAPSPDYEPVEYLDAQGRYAGITAEFFRLMEARLGRTFTVVQPTPRQWLQLRPDLREADLITASAPTSRREQFWTYTEPFLKLPAYVITRDSAGDDLTPARLGAARVAVVQGWAAEEYLRSHFTNLTIEPVPTPEEGLRRVSFGLVDAFVSELPVATAWMEKDGITNLKVSAPAGFTYELCISTRRDWPELHDIMEKALATITPAERQQVMEHWLTLKTPEERRRERRWHEALWSAASLLLLLLGLLGWNRLLAWRVLARTRQLHQNELRLSLMAELIAGFSFSYLVAPDRTTRLEWLSQAGEKVLSYTEAELRSDVRMHDHIHPDDLPGFDRAIEMVLAGIPEVMEFRFRTKSGRMRWLQSFVRPEWSETEKRVVRILGAGQDITERRTSQQALRDSIENTPIVGVMWLDEAGRVTYWNRAAQHIYGWTATEVMRQKLGRLMHTPEQESQFDRLIQEIKTTGKTAGSMEIRFRGRDGRNGVCRSTLFAIPAPEGGKIYVRMDIDLTDLKQAEADREKLVDELHVAEDAERRRIARELHDTTAQQLAVLKMNLSLLRKNMANPPAQFDDCLAAADQAIQEIRNFTWLLHPPLLDELGLPRALTDYAAGFARRTGIETVVETGNFSGRLPDAMELALFRVVQESLTNILRHSGSKTAIIRLDRDESEVRLEIQDSGNGMNVAAMKCGVGVTGMRERLRMVGGCLEIESDPEGTTVLATVPLAAEAGQRGTG